MLVRGGRGGPPLCDIPSGCCFFTGPWTVTRSSLRMLRWVAAFCRPLRPVLLLVSFPRSRSPVVGVLGLCWMWGDVPFARQRRPIIGVLRMCWLLQGSFDCFCGPRASVHRLSIACLAVFLGGDPPPKETTTRHNVTQGGRGGTINTRNREITHCAGTVISLISTPEPTGRHSAQHKFMQQATHLSVLQCHFLRQGCPQGKKKGS